MFKYIVFAMVMFITAKPVMADNFPSDGMQLNLDHGFHNVGKVWQVVSNIGGYLGFHCFTTYAPNLRCEYPVGSGNSYLFTGSFCIAAKRNGRKLFSTGDAWSRNSTNCAYEFFPSAEPWDHVYDVRRGQTIDIPYYPNFTPLADQALVMRYNDYTIRPEDQEFPLSVEVIQVSHQWSTAPFDEWILFEFFVFPTDEDLTDAWLSFWVGANLLPGDAPGLDDDNLTYYDEERRMGIVEDLPGGGDDNIAGPIGFMLFPPDGYDGDDLQWTFNNSIMIDHFDVDQYDVTAAGSIEPPSLDGDGRSNPGFFRVAFGPIDLAVGDTAHFYVAEIFAEGGADKALAKSNFLTNADRMIWLKNNNFATPSPPPAPRVRVVTDNHTVTLNWEIQPGEVNPEEYQDTVRLDNHDKPFEGYRVYKSTQGIGGPWTMLEEYDIADNEFNSNTGLAYEYTDVGLVNNLEYYYSVISFSKPDTISFFPSQETGISASAVAVTPGTAAPNTVGKVAVVPNPYRADVRYQDFSPPWEQGTGSFGWTESDRRVQFINVPSPAEIKIYTLAGDLVDTIAHNNPNRGFVDWNLTSSVALTISAGIYLFTVEDLNGGEVQVGKFVVIK